MASTVVVVFDHEAHVRVTQEIQSLVTSSREISYPSTRVVSMCDTCWTTWPCFAVRTGILEGVEGSNG